MNINLSTLLKAIIGGAGFALSGGLSLADPNAYCNGDYHRYLCCPWRHNRKCFGRKGNSKLKCGNSVSQVGFTQ